MGKLLSKSIAIMIVPLVFLVLSLSIVAPAAWADDAKLQSGTIMTTQSGKMTVSKTKLDLSPKAKKISNGYSYSAKKATVKVTMPFKGTVYFKSTNPYVATGKWSMKWNGWTTSLAITGHARGKATIIIYNNVNSQKLKVAVTVGGCGIGVRLNDMKEFSYTKKNGLNGYYKLDNISLINATKNKIVLNKTCAFKYWSVDADGRYVSKGEMDSIRGLPVTVNKGKSKVVYLGEKFYVDEEGNYLDENEETSYWKKAALTLRLGSSYKTIYVDAYGMVTKIRNGRDF